MDSGSGMNPGDPVLINNIVTQLKSQGLFDQFRKECISEVDTKPAYQNLRHRVDMYVSSYLSTLRWTPNLNKNQLREHIRKYVSECPFLEPGIERVVEQVVNPKIHPVLVPKVEDVVYKFVGIKSKDGNEEETKYSSQKQRYTNTQIKPVKYSDNSDLAGKFKSQQSKSEHDSSKVSVTTVASEYNAEDDDISPPFELHTSSNNKLSVNSEIKLKSFHISIIKEDLSEMSKTPNIDLEIKDQNNLKHSDKISKSETESFVHNTKSNEKSDIPKTIKDKKLDNPKCNTKDASKHSSKDDKLDEKHKEKHHSSQHDKKCNDFSKHQEKRKESLRSDNKEDKYKDKKHKSKSDKSEKDHKNKLDEHDKCEKIKDPEKAIQSYKAKSDKSEKTVPSNPKGKSDKIETKSEKCKSYEKTVQSDHKSKSDKGGDKAEKNKDSEKIIHCDNDERKYHRHKSDQTRDSSEDKKKTKVSHDLKEKSDSSSHKHKTESSSESHSHKKKKKSDKSDKDNCKSDKKDRNNRRSSDRDSNGPPPSSSSHRSRSSCSTTRKSCNDSSSTKHNQSSSSSSNKSKHASNPHITALKRKPKIAANIHEVKKISDLRKMYDLHTYNKTNTGEDGQLDGTSDDIIIHDDNNNSNNSIPDDTLSKISTVVKLSKIDVNVNKGMISELPLNEKKCNTQNHKEHSELSVIQNGCNGENDKEFGDVDVITNEYNNKNNDKTFNNLETIKKCYTDENLSDYDIISDDCCNSENCEYESNKKSKIVSKKSTKTKNLANNQKQSIKLTNDTNVQFLPRSELILKRPNDKTSLNKKNCKRQNQYIEAKNPGQVTKYSFKKYLVKVQKIVFKKNNKTRKHFRAIKRDMFDHNDKRPLNTKKEDSDVDIEDILKYIDVSKCNTGGDNYRTNFNNRNGRMLHQERISNVKNEIDNNSSISDAGNILIDLRVSLTKVDTMYHIVNGTYITAKNNTNTKEQNGNDGSISTNANNNNTSEHSTAKTVKNTKQSKNEQNENDESISSNTNNNTSEHSAVQTIKNMTPSKKEDSGNDESISSNINNNSNTSEHTTVKTVKYKTSKINEESDNILETINSIIGYDKSVHVINISDNSEDITQFIRNTVLNINNTRDMEGKTTPNNEKLVSEDSKYKTQIVSKEPETVYKKESHAKYNPVSIRTIKLETDVISPNWISCINEQNDKSEESNCEREFEKSIDSLDESSTKGIQMRDLPVENLSSNCLQDEGPYFAGYYIENDDNTSRGNNNFKLGAPFHNCLLGIFKHPDGEISPSRSLKVKIEPVCDSDRSTLKDAIPVIKLEIENGCNFKLIPDTIQEESFCDIEINNKIDILNILNRLNSSYFKFLTLNGKEFITYVTPLFKSNCVSIKMEPFFDDYQLLQHFSTKDDKAKIKKVNFLQEGASKTKENKNTIVNSNTYRKRKISISDMCDAKNSVVEKCDDFEKKAKQHKTSFTQENSKIIIKTIRKNRAKIIRKNTPSLTNGIGHDLSKLQSKGKSKSPQQIQENGKKSDMGDRVLDCKEINVFSTNNIKEHISCINIAGDTSLSNTNNKFTHSNNLKRKDACSSNIKKQLNSHFYSSDDLYKPRNQLHLTTNRQKNIIR